MKESAAKKKKKKLQIVWLRKYDLDYMEIGFTEAGADVEPEV